MKADLLQDALGEIRDDFVLEAHGGPAVRKRTWRRWGSLAACLCLLAVCAFGLPKLLHQKAPTPEPKPPVSDPGHGSITEPDPQPVDPLGDWPVVYNQATAVPDEGKMSFCMFSEKLTEEERAAIVPDGLPDWLELRGAAALYCGWEEGVLNCVELSLVNPHTGDRLEVCICPPGQRPISDEIIIPVDTVPTSIDGRDVILCQYGGMLWTDFSAGGVDYCVSASGQTEELDRIKEDFFMLVVSLIRSDTSPELERLQFHPERHVFQDKRLTMEEAQADPDFGRFFPRTAPKGLGDGEISRQQNRDLGVDCLNGSWSVGYDYLTWTVRPAKLDNAAARIVSPDEREKYDLRLYSIPLYESVPEEYRATVFEPVFRAEELTEDLVRARCAESDGDAPWIRFSVLFGDAVVEITAKGVTPEEIYAMVDALR